MKTTDVSRLLILWTTGDPLTAKDMILLYGTNAVKHGWWDEVTLLIWGAADSLVARDEEVQEKLHLAIETGVRVIACRKCAEEQGVADTLKQMGIKVFYTGEFLTDWLKSDGKILSI